MKSGPRRIPRRAGVAGPFGPAPASLAERVASVRPRMGDAGQRVLDLVTGEPDAILSASALHLAESARTSDATVVRVAQALGFNGLVDLRRAVREARSDEEPSRGELERTLHALGLNGRSPADALLAGLQSTLAGLRTPTVRARLDRAIEILQRARRVRVRGAESCPALVPATREVLARLGCTVACGPASAGPLGPGEALVVLAEGRLSAAIEAEVRDAESTRTPVLLFGAVPSSLLGSAAMLTVPLEGRLPGRHRLSVLPLLLLELAATAAAARGYSHAP